MIWNGCKIALRCFNTADVFQIFSRCITDVSGKLLLNAQNIGKTFTLCLFIYFIFLPKIDISFTRYQMHNFLLVTKLSQPEMYNDKTQKF